MPLAARVCVYCSGDQHPDGVADQPSSGAADQQPGGLADQRPGGVADQQPGGAADQQHGDNTVHTELDCEVHFLARCKRFETKRACFKKRLECLIPNLNNLTEIEFVKTILCPVSMQAAKLADKYIGIMFRAREDIDSGIICNEYPTWNPNSANPFKLYDTENDDETHHLDDEDIATDSSDDEP